MDELVPKSEWIPDRAWFSRGALDVAPDLLGGHIVSETPQGRVAVRITEVEAYLGTADPGSHAFRGPTKRTAVMFGPAGHLYVYFSYGMHWCMNIVCGPTGEAAAVLIRAGEVISGHELARERRPAARRDADLARGPARLTSALGIDARADGLDLFQPDAPIRITFPTRGGGAVPNSEIITGGRVGVAGPGGDGDTYPWRYSINLDSTVSQYRPGTRRSRK